VNPSYVDSAACLIIYEERVSQRMRYDARIVVYQFIRIYVYVSSTARTLMHANAYPDPWSKLV